MDRRTFLQHGAAAAAGGLVTPACAREASTPATGTMERIGVQLYTVRDRMAESVPRTLGQVAEMGYDEVEFAGYFGHSPAQIREFLGESSLTSPAAHVGLDDLRSNPDGLIEAARIIGHEYLIVPFLSPQERTTLDDYRRVAEEFNAVGARCRDGGIRLGYHNHAFEFEPIDDEIPYDVLLANTDQALVDMELDLFWIRAGGRDPLPYFERHPGRFVLCHVKDMDAQEEMVDVGQGAIDFAQIFARSPQAGLRYYFVEHDAPGNSLRSIERSYRYLAELTY